MPKFKLCPECRDRFNAYVRELRRSKPRYCKDCGKEIKDVKARHLRCAKCRRVRRAKQHLTAVRKYNAKQRRKENRNG